MADFLRIPARPRYGTTKSLERWYEKYQKNGELSRGCIISKPRYSIEQKKVATDYYLSHGQCLAATIKVLGYPVPATLSDWLDERHLERKERAVGNASGIRFAQKTMIGTVRYFVFEAVKATRFSAGSGLRISQS